MSNHSICIDSPYFRAPPTFNSQNREDNDIQHQEPQANRFILTSPQILPPTIKMLNSSNPKTPWPFLTNNDQDSTPALLSLPSVFPNENHKDTAIRDLITFSQAEEECGVVTPAVEHMTPVDNLMDLEVFSTGKKKGLDSLQFSRNPRGRGGGLRKLSEMVLEVMQNVKQVTYKEVASWMVDLFKHQSSSEIEVESREEMKQHNVKRRVYDAINVLIASGVLKKDGHKISCLQMKSRKELPANHQLRNLNEELAERTQMMEEKKRKLKETQKKYQAVRFISTRNQLQRPYSKGKISFPFVGVHVGYFNGKTVQISESGLIIRTRGGIQPFGDIDSLNWLRESSGITDQISLCI